MTDRGNVGTVASGPAGAGGDEGPHDDTHAVTADATTGATLTDRERRTADDLRTLAPHREPRYRAAVPGARAAVLARLWGALAREPIADIRGRHRAGGRLVVTLTDGRRVSGHQAVAEPFARADDGFTVTLDGQPYDQPARLVEALHLGGATGQLAAELDDSVANLALARAGQPAPDGGPPALTRPGIPVEQLVVDGHPLHPGCRTRLGMSTRDILRYAPEHRTHVDLVEVAVPPDRWLSTGTGLPPRLLMHPWQADHLLADHPDLRPTGRTVPARPLMSLRTLETADGHVKTAVDVQMTSAVRTVSAAAVHNGPVLSALLARLAASTRGLEILKEPAAGIVVLAGAGCRSLAMVCRERPRPGDVVVPLAALSAPSPADGRPLAVEAITLGYAGRPVEFFTDLVNLLFAPVTTLLHLGVALEAHGQNMMVALRAGRPVRVVYRDLGGVRVSPRRLARHGFEAPPLRGDLMSDDPAVLRTKLAAAALSTVVAETITTITREYGVEPARLWEVAAGALRSAYAELPAQARADRVTLLERPLPVKATTAMRLADDPLEDRWAWLPNPVAGGR